MYDGFSIPCGCTCKRCGSSVKLEGHADAQGSHFCITCQDYVQTTPAPCNARTPKQMKLRQREITRAEQKGGLN